MVVSSPNSLIIQPASSTAGEAVMVRCPQLGRSGDLSRVFLTGSLGVTKREGVTSAGRPVVKHHTYTDRPRDRWQTVLIPFNLTDIPTQSESIHRGNVISQHVIRGHKQIKQSNTLVSAEISHMNTQKKKKRESERNRYWYSVQTL